MLKAALEVPATLWLTGLSGSGKTTLAQAMRQRLLDAGRPCFVLDGDVVRTGLCSDLGFSPSDRHENIRRVAEVARLMNEAGLLVLCALISPLRDDRLMAARIIGESRFIEVHVSTPLEICEQRDPKGLYRRARLGELKEFTGVSTAYEEPLTPALRLDTGRQSLPQALSLLNGLLCGAMSPSASSQG